MANNYSDLPEGAVIEYVPPSAPAAAPGVPMADAAEAAFSDLPEGATVEYTPEEEDPFFGMAPTREKDALLKNLRTLTERKAPPEVIRDYARQSGAVLPEETERWLDDVYAAEPYETNFEPRDPPDVTGGGAAMQGLLSGALFGFDDEISAGAGALGNIVGRGFGANASTGSLSDIYDELLSQNRQYKDTAFAERPLAYGGGFVPGALLSAVALPGARAAQAETTLGRVAQATGQGAMGGGLSGAGNAEGGVLSRLAGGGQGAAIGGPMGALSYPLSQLFGGLGRRTYRSIRGDRPWFGHDPQNSGLEAMMSRAPQDAGSMRNATQDAAAMRAEAARFNQAGIPPRVMDVVDESGRGVIRDAASKMTPGRTAVVDHAKDVAIGAQDDVADLAAREITDNPQTARQLERQIRGSKNLGGDNEAGILMGEAMEPLRGRTITMDADMQSVLSTREGMAALRAAEGLMTDPAERASARALLAAARKAAKGPTDPEDAFRAEVKGWDDMPDAVKDAYRQQRPDLGADADPFEGVTLSLDLADKFSRAMRGRAAKTPGLERVAEQFANTVRGSARRQVPEYDEALTSYSDSQRVADAAAGTGTFEESKFLSTAPDTYAASVSQASREPTAVRGMGDNGGPPMVSEADALVRRARDEIVDKAQGGSGQNAHAVTSQLARGRGQQARSNALLGPERGERLREGAGVLRDRLDHTAYVNPNAGSKTFGAAQDAIVDGFADAAAATAGGWWAKAHLAGKWLKQGGIKGVDAERLARDAISDDPARVSAAIDFLETRGMARARAERFISVYAAALAGRLGGASVDDKVRAPAHNSVQAVNRGGVQP